MAKKRKVNLVKPEKILRKKYTSGVASNIVVSGEEMLWLPSRFLAFNDQLGGGIPYGKILELYGEESSGKSILALDFAYCTQALNGMVLWADSEFAFTHDWAITNNLNLDKVELFKEKSIEIISDWSLDMGYYYRSKLTNNEPMLLVIDSIAALDCMENMGSSQVEAKAEMGNRAKAIDKMLRSRNGDWEKIGMSVICINQLRSKIGATQFQDPDTTPGGKALRFYASQRIGVYGGKQIKEKIHKVEERVGRIASIRVKKNKVAPPKPTIKQAPVYFLGGLKGYVGFSRYHGFADILLRNGVVTKKGSRYYLRDKMIANGESAFTKLIEKNEKLRSKLVRKSGVNTISKTRKKMESIGANLYPVKPAEDE